MAIAAVGALTIGFLPDQFARWREPALDRLLPLTKPVSDNAVAVVDIGSPDASTNPWSRAQTAQLLVVIANQGASALALDMVLSADCSDTPQNIALGQAIAGIPTTLGFLLADEDRGLPESAPTIAARQGLALPSIWQAQGAEHACPRFEAQAAGSGAASLAGGRDAIVREAPALVVAGGRAYLGLALDAVRLAKQIGVVIIGGDPAWLRLGERQLDIGPAASLRIRPGASDMVAQRTVSAADVLAGSVPSAFFAGKVVFIGNSAPQAGALRTTASHPLYPSVQIHADLAAAILAGQLPQRPDWAVALEGWGAMAMALIAAAAGALGAPGLAASCLFALVVIWIGGALGLAATLDLLVDPVASPTIAVLSGLAAILVQAARTRRAESALRRRIGQLLPPGVVARFVREPDLLRLEGEERMVTALFTDIEGFSQTLNNMDPRHFVRVLDAYFTGMTTIVLAHGGMIDKLVGDAVHALFNAPTDLDGHVDKAIACACALEDFAESFRRRPEILEIHFGRTRIGIETGRAILGDVGPADKIDYTAHGASINLAARLEQANKELGSSICIGPAAAALATMKLRELGEIDVKGFGAVQVFTVTTQASGFSAPP